MTPKWQVRPNGTCVRPHLTPCGMNGRVCLSDGLQVPHSHYEWAANIGWAQMGDVMHDKPMPIELGESAWELLGTLQG